MKRLGVFGGTFDPVHFGHLLPTIEVARIFALDALVFVPAAHPPHKPKQPISSFAHRFAMLALALAPHERFLLSDLEQTRNGPSYTVDTLRAISADWRAEALFFVMGSDSLTQITTWHRWPELVDLAHLVVLHREPLWGAKLEQCIPDLLRPRLRRVGASGQSNITAAGRAGQVFLLDHQPYPIAATAVRERLRRGDEVDGMVPGEVSRYAIRNRVYHQSESGD